MADPTPRPWRKCGKAIRGLRTTGRNRDGTDDLPLMTGYSAPGTWSDETDANLALAVKAVNCHDQLVAALKTVDKLADEFAPSTIAKAFKNAIHAALAAAEPTT